MNRLVVLGCCLVIVPAIVWSLECYHCSGTITHCHHSSNKSLVLKCTPTNNRCYTRKITEIDSEDKLDVGCTNEDGCSIHKKDCDNTGDCTASCCEEDLCNSGLSKKACVLFNSLVIAASVAFGLLM